MTNISKTANFKTNLNDRHFKNYKNKLFMIGTLVNSNTQYACTKFYINVFSIKIHLGI